MALCVGWLQGSWFERNTGERVGETYEWLYKLESHDDIPFLSVEITELSGGRILYQTSQISHDNLEISLPLWCCVDSRCCL